jgi:hypothetical protein
VARRKPPVSAARFAEVSVRRAGYVVPVDATTYVHMPREFGVFDADEWQPRCREYGADCAQPGSRWEAWCFARAGWCGANLSFDEAWADSMYVTSSLDHGEHTWHFHSELL